VEGRPQERGLHADREVADGEDASDPEDPRRRVVA
jgi:hypothetical protein